MSFSFPGGTSGALPHASAYGTNGSDHCGPVLELNGLIRSALSYSLMTAIALAVRTADRLSSARHGNRLNSSNLLVRPKPDSQLPTLCGHFAHLIWGFTYWLTRQQSGLSSTQR
jgi:hypothetical protein